MPKQIVSSSIVMLGLSVDGANEASYAKIRLGGDYQKLRRNLAAFKAYKKRAGHGPMIVARSVIMARAQAEAANYVAAFSREWEDLCDRIKFNTLMPMDKEVIYDTGRVCDDIFYNVRVRWDGRVPLCNYQNHYAEAEWLGNVVDAPLAALWKGLRPNEVRQAHLQQDLSKPTSVNAAFSSNAKAKPNATRDASIAIKILRRNLRTRRLENPALMP